MKRSSLFFVLLITLFLVVGCDGGGGSATIDLTGTWNWSQRVTTQICDWGEPVGTVHTGQIVANQSGTRLVLRTPSGTNYEGSIVGNTITISFINRGV